MIDRVPPLLARLLGIADIEELGEAWSTRPITHCCSEDLGEYAFAGVELAEVVSVDEIPASSARRLRFEDGRQYSDTFTGPRIGTDDIVAAVQAGDSVMIRGIDAFSRIALLLARRLLFDLGCRVLANLFVSPAFGTALGRHAVRKRSSIFSFRVTRRGEYSSQTMGLAGRSVRPRRLA